MSRFSRVMVGALAMAAAFPLWADHDALHKALKEREGKTATVILASGAELTGTVAKVDEDSVRLSSLSGKEFFDAVIALDKVQAVQFRAREK